jgi:hypothetical protein
MARITAARRAALPKSQFALPEKDGYPVDTARRARSALSRASANATPAEQSKIRAKVKREYPSMQVSQPAARAGNSGRSSNSRISGELNRRLGARDKR